MGEPMKNLNVGISFPFRFSEGRVVMVGGEAGRVPMNQDLDDAARESARQILLTGKGERVMLGQFGVGAERYLFSPASRLMASFIERDITEQMEFWSGRAQLAEVIAAPEPALKEIAVYLRMVHNNRSGETSVNLTIGSGASGG
ncbi:MAG: hypothetical protein A2Y38_04890 [Spirochaetes bacterium GWB1_59_5]|nr:MAG: hypothetical protein A2Y38_04890 [Spirochaetes bacterium GWB1_59_5]